MKRCKSDPAAKVVWCDRGWQPVYYGFCPSRRAWSREMRRLGVAGRSDTSYPTSHGCTTSFEKDGKLCLIVSLCERTSRQRTRVEIAGLLCHEATHVWQLIRDQISEPNPGREMEAYAVQAIFQSLYQAWLDTMAPSEMKAACAKTVKEQPDGFDR